ncbi:MAG: DUF6125 family protein [Dehalococcoidales bacterium]
MEELSTDQKIQFLHRSYSAVDGLWFMKVEEKYGFDAALDIDQEVWQVLPKIQARILKTMLGLDGGIVGLARSLFVRLRLDEFKYRLEKQTDTELEISIDSCPWQALLEKSGRANLSGRIGDRVCKADYTVWAHEFGKDIKFNLTSQICKGAKKCVMSFTMEPNP